MVFVPAFALLGSLGGVSMFGALVTALLAGFVLELAHVKEGLLMSLWVSCVWVVMTFAWELHEGGLLLLTQACLLVISLAMWASLQFPWFQALLPSACVLFERLLFSASTVSAAALLIWKALAHFGLESAPLIVFGVQHYVYSLLCLPRPTAFREQLPGVATSEYYISSYPESFLLTTTYLLLPAAMQTVMFRGVFFTQLQLSNFGLALSLPLLGLAWLWPHRPLWFLASFPRTLSAMKVLTSVVTLFLFLPAFCYRFVFPSHLEDLPFPLFLVHLAMLAGVLGCVLAFVAHQMDWLGKRREKLAYGAAAAAAVAACVGLGAPLWLWPFGLLSAAALLNFYFTRHGKPYVVALASTTICLVWFTSSKLAFVSFHFARADMPLGSVLGLLASVFVGAFLVLGLWLSRQPTKLNDSALLVYSAFFAIAEWLLAYGHDDDTRLYPEYLVAVTSVAGMYLCHAAASQRNKFISRSGSWSCACIWLAKSGTGERERSLIIISHFLLILATLICHSRDSLIADAILLLVSWCLAPIAYRWETPKSMLTQQLLFLVAMSGVVALVSASSSVAHCLGSFVLPESALQSQTVMAGGAAAAWALYCLVVSLRFASARPLAHAVALFVLVSALAVVALQPEMYSWALVFEDEDTVVAVSPYAKWLLLSLVIALLGFSLVPWTRQQVRRVGTVPFSLLIGSVASTYVSMQFFVPYGVYEEWGAVQGLFFVMLTVFVVLAVDVGLVLSLQLAEPMLWPRVAVASLQIPICYFAVGAILHNSDQLEAVRIFLLGMWAVSEFVLALVLAVQSGAILTSSSAMEISTVTLSRLDRDEKRRSSVKKHTAGDVSLAHVSANLAASDVYERRLIGNVATIVCLFVSQYLALMHLDASSSVSSLALAPLLLLLSKDQKLIRSPFGYYLPPLLFVSASLVTFGFARAVTSESIVKNLLLMILTIPSLVFLALASRSSTKSLFWALVTFPGTLVTLLFADVSERLWVFLLSLGWTAYLFVTWYCAKPRVHERI